MTSLRKCEALFQAFMFLYIQIPKASVMINIRKRYIVDENNNRIAVQLDLDTYEKIEEILEKYCLKQEIENQKDDIAFDKSKGVYNKFGQVDQSAFLIIQSFNTNC